MMSYILVTILTLFVFNNAEGCSIVSEVEKILETIIVHYAPNKTQIPMYRKCLRSFFFCERHKCDLQEFKLPQAPNCESLLINNVFDYVCLKNFDSFIRTFINSDDSFAGICEQIISFDVDHMIADYDKKPGICDRYPNTCQQVRKISQKVKAIFSNFSDLMFHKKIFKRYSGSIIKAISKGVRMSFRYYDDSDIQKVSDCTRELFAIAEQNYTNHTTKKKTTK